MTAACLPPKGLRHITITSYWKRMKRKRTRTKTEAKEKGKDIIARGANHNKE
ncbi:hypothetical protein SCLCIDRAFT_1221632 [Scleroderma citrinum Foug A]|uniref:Uncharacterized protein n=1 Tax=Scleroderma citrinum Foug A TaxID=1036808 RepID=A0A0C2YYY5_9AGAM|nr:hypothetical protein SCLCIDRAFT_1221632 [Scleroderma citrinum Foug A]